MDDCRNSKCGAAAAVHELPHTSPPRDARFVHLEATRHAKIVGSGGGGRTALATRCRRTRLRWILLAVGARCVGSFGTGRSSLRAIPIARPATVTSIGLEPVLRLAGGKAEKSVARSSSSSRCNAPSGISRRFSRARGQRQRSNEGQKPRNRGSRIADVTHRSSPSAFTSTSTTGRRWTQVENPILDAIQFVSTQRRTLFRHLYTAGRRG